MCAYSHTLLLFTLAVLWLLSQVSPRQAQVAYFWTWDITRWGFDTGPIRDEGCKDASGPPGGSGFLEYHFPKPAPGLVEWNDAQRSKIPDISHLYGL